MKNIKLLNPPLFILFAIGLSLVLSQCSTSQKAVKLTSNNIKNMVDSSHFVFVADRAIPLRGSSRYLTSDYEVTIKKDTLNSYLPYFGRAYQAPIDPTKGGIQFISTNFTYQVNPKGSNQWNIIIKPNDNRDVLQMYFDIFDNGTANLNIVNTHKDPISFDGHIERVKN